MQGTKESVSVSTPPSAFGTPKQRRVNLLSPLLDPNYSSGLEVGKLLLKRLDNIQALLTTLSLLQPLNSVITGVSGHRQYTDKREFFKTVGE